MTGFACRGLTPKSWGIHSNCGTIPPQAKLDRTGLGYKRRHGLCVQPLYAQTQLDASTPPRVVQIMPDRLLEVVVTHTRPRFTMTR